MQTRFWYKHLAATITQTLHYEQLGKYVTELALMRGL